MSTPQVLNDAAVKAIAELSRQATGFDAKIITADGEIDNQAIPFAWVGGRTLSLEEFLANPVAKKGSHTFIDRDSFVAHVNDHKEKGTTIYASLKGSSLTCVFDDHKPGEGADAGWQRHKVTLDLQPDPDWQAWLGMQKAMEQDDFAGAIRDLAHTIEVPDAAELQDIIRKFSATQVLKFERPKFNEQNGSITFNYEDETQQTGSMRLPEKLYIAVSPYRSVAPVTTEALTRYRFANGKVLFYVHFVRPDKVEEEAFRAVIRHIEEKTGLVVRICA